MSTITSQSLRRAEPSPHSEPRTQAAEEAHGRSCRSCGEPLSTTFADLGAAPPSNSFLAAAELDAPEPFLKLHAYVCDSCLLVQIERMRAPEDIFRHDYAYFSSYSDTWLKHCEDYVSQVVARFGLGAESTVIEIASNDGYLLQYFKGHGVPVLGIEPAANVAEAAEKERGVPTLVEFFGSALARRLCDEGRSADLLIGNNVLAHVPDLNDFVAGLGIALKTSGVLTMEFPHLLRLMAENQFDTIYHEHYSYFSLLAVERVFARHGMTIFDVEQLRTHGGSLRIYVCRAEAGRPIGKRVLALRAEEHRAGLERIETYARFADQVRSTKRRLLSFLIAAKNEGKSIAGYGAPAKGNTLLNYCGIGTDFIDYVVDRNPHKQGMFLPGSRIPCLHPDRIRETRPDYLLILPWNLKEEVIAANAFVREWGGKFVVPIPEVEVID